MALERKRLFDPGDFVVTFAGSPFPKCESLRIGSFEDFDIPVEVIPPAFGDLLISDGDPDGRHPRGPAGFSDEPHRSFCRCSAALLPVAFHATGDDVFPLGLASAGLGNHMIVSQLL